MNDSIKKMPLLKSIKDTLREDGSLLVAGLGDSLTQGWMVRRGFFDRFIDDLKEIFSGASISSLNAGIPGDTSAGGLRRLGTVLARSPNLVTVQFAINDMFSGVDDDRFAQTMSEITETILEGGFCPLLVTSCPLQDEVDQHQATRFYDQIRRLGEKFNVPVADLDLYWRNNEGGTHLYQADEVHPTDMGHQLMADGLMSLFVN